MGGGTQVLDVLAGLLAEQGRSPEADRLRREGLSQDAFRVVINLRDSPSWQGLDR